MRTGISWSGLRIAVVALLVLLLAAPAATARSVSDPDIGWPSTLRKQLRLPKIAAAKPCKRDDMRTAMRVQNRIHRRAPDVDRVLYRIFHNRPTNIWGSAWFMPCDGDRMQVGVASGGSARDTRAAVREARRYLRKKKLTRSVRLVAVRSTYRELSDQIIELEPFEEVMLRSRDLSWGIDTQRNAVVIEGDHGVPEADRERFREFARTSPVNVIVRFERAPDPNAPIPTYTATFVLDRGSIDRDGRTVTLKIDDPSCSADETNDTAERFAGVRIRKLAHAYALTARLRVNPEWGASTCEGNSDPRTSITTTVTLPAPLGRRGIVDGAPGPGDFRFVALPPVGAKAIRSLAPKYQYSGDDCDTRDVRQAFKGRKKTEWCFY